MTGMTDYILFVHDDAATDDSSSWDAYLQTLKQSGVFEGGSEIGGGICMRKGGRSGHHQAFDRIYSRHCRDDRRGQVFLDW
jgi:hypothetical protein